MIKQIIILALVIAGIVAILTWSGNRTDKVIKAAELYEECVVKEYGVSPSYWYQEHGEYPTCPKN